MKNNKNNKFPNNKQFIAYKKIINYKLNKVTQILIGTIFCVMFNNFDPHFPQKNLK